MTFDHDYCYSFSFSSRVRVRVRVKGKRITKVVFKSYAFLLDQKKEKIKGTKRGIPFNIEEWFKIIVINFDQ